MKIDEINEYIELVFKEKTKEIQKKIYDLKALIEIELLKQVDKEVIEFSKKFSHYLNTSNRIDFNGNGLSHDYIYLNDNNRLVCKIYKVTDEIYTLFLQFKNTKKEFEEKKKSLFEIFKNLKTEKRILEVYPEFEGVITIKKKSEALICKDSDIVNYLNS